MKSSIAFLESPKVDLFDNKKTFHHQLLSLLRAILMILFLSTVVLSSNFMVTKIADTNDGVCDSDCSFREAIEAANAVNSDDEINFDLNIFNTSQTIVLTGGELTIANNGDLTINGLGVNQLEINGNNLSRVFYVEASATAVISGVSITNGSVASIGGGVLVDGNLTMNNSIIANNFSQNSGGGIGVNTGGMLTLNNSEVSNNRSNNVGGGIQNSCGIVVLNSSNIINNETTRDGGGIRNCGTLSVNSSTVRENSSNLFGGGIYNSGIATISNSTVKENTGNDGGGVYNVVNSLRITNSTISSNLANDDGGGIRISGGTAIVINSTISMNIANLTGGGIENNGTIDLYNSTIVQNLARVQGGGVENDNGIVNAKNTIIANNTDTGTAPDFLGMLTSQGYNLIRNPNNTNIIGNTQGNIIGVAPLIGPLQNNGGLTETHALLPGSPAIDKGSAADIPPSISTDGKKISQFLLVPLMNDQRGILRPLDLPLVTNAIGGNGSDIGAFEALGPTSSQVQITGRVLDRNGRGIPRAIIQLVDQNGEIKVKRSNNFGFYRFNGINAGETVSLNVFSKQYSFLPAVVTVNEDLRGLIFIAQ